MAQNPQAFPCAADTRLNESGMTLRDYFAAASLTGLDVWNDPKDAAEIAKRAYAFADAMLAERAKGDR